MDFSTPNLGFTYGHELYISGRMKEVIVIRGQNIFPQDIERIVEQFLGLTGQNCVAAFSLNSGDANESLGIVIGTRERTIESKADVCHRSTRCDQKCMASG